ncbi:RHS repeat-associated core domain-containing protein [Pseudomonas putida]|jgi:RHS repeat-associated protein|nr:RHS repeat-associated core domain-containing protein [Pseudomonas putida]EKT4471181.1 RHS repeat-associated core domain-containing protein [Pseudomonas putida]EKT4496080.1 RHS repeat-associated core domain-containing protein [Pseudomonas putida]EKT4515699.1 RHS repeat-associated core domain-containing protein [Pseudomonas putida]EKT4530302.1 RHS repeat-associated core domain-containing protein [Pseudomonas putida]
MEDTGVKSHVNYSPYGYPGPGALNCVLGFNGEYRSDLSGFYVLGRGVRSFSSILMRFLSPDPYSPFSLGGLNIYAYCAGDPVNRVDRSGYFFSAAMTQKIHRWRISAQLTVTYRYAPTSKQFIDSQAAGIAKNYGGSLISTSFKQNRLRVIDNVQRLGVQHPRELGDIVRNMVILPQEQMSSAAKDLGRIFKSKPRNFSGTAAGYRGIHVRYSPRGRVHGETQFHTKQQAFAILPENVARPVIGADLYDAWSSKAQAQGFHPGQAHELYEIFRVSGDSNNIREISLANSRAYWSFIESLN